MSNIPTNGGRAGSGRSSFFFHVLWTPPIMIVGLSALGWLTLHQNRPWPLWLDVVVTTVWVGLLALLAAVAARIHRRLRCGDLEYQKEHGLRRDLEALQEVGNELSTAPDISSLCRRAVELGREKLGFERLGIWLEDKINESIVGSWGVDENGNLRDERSVVLRKDQVPLVFNILGQGQRFHLTRNAPVFNHINEQVGIGDRAAAGMWNGNAFIGIVFTDNLIKRGPLTDEKCQILELFAATLGHLCTLKRAEAEKREGEERFRAVAEEMPESLLLIDPVPDDPPGRIIYANAAAARNYGRPLSELIGLHTRELNAPETVVESPERMKRLMAGETIRFEGSHLRKNGESFPVEVSAQLIQSQGRKTIVALARDFTERLKAETALKESEERFRVIAQQVPESIFLIEPDELNPPGRIVFANESAARIHGWPMEELIGKQVHELDDAETAEQSFGRLARVLAGETIRFSGRHRRKDGQVFPVEICARMIQYAGRNLVLSLSRDETERIASEKALRESEERFRSVLSAIPDVILILDADGRYRGIFTSEEGLLVKPVSQLLGRTIYEAHPNAPLESFRRMIEETIRTGVLGQFEYPLHLDSGRRWFSARIVPFGSPDDPCVLWVSRDVTERKQAELALRENEQRFRGYFEQPLVGMAISSPGGECLEANDEMCRLLGRSRGEVIGKNWIEMVHPGDAEATQRRYQQTLQGETDGHTWDRRYLGGDGIVRPVTVSARVMRDAKGAPHHIFTIALDISARQKAEEERRRMEAQLQHAQKLESLGVLAGGIAHDFNNLLVAILGNADLAMMELRPESTARPLLENIEKAARRAAELTNQMLAYSGKGRFVVDLVDLNTIIREMSHLLAVSVTKMAVLKYNFADNLPLIEADPAQVRQVVINFVTNASEAIGERSGVIAVSTGVLFADAVYIRTAYAKENVEAGYFVYIEVADTGQGMDPRTLQRMFDPFFTTKETGRGLGLAAALGIVHGHRGMIGVQTEKNRGTTFRALFPSSDKEGATPTARSGAQPAKELPKGEGLILVADDEESVRAVARRSLERVGFKVLAAADGAEAVKVYRERSGDISAVLLDMTMPHKNGAEAFQEMQAIRPDVIAILSSGYSEQDAIGGFSGKGLAGFIQKPYHPVDLARIMIEALANVERSTSE